jgi:hypothetical protein
MATRGFAVRIALHKRVFPIVLLASCAATAAFALYATRVPRVSVHQLRHAIEIAVPVGTAEVDLRAWLAAQPHFRYSGDIADKNTGQIRGIEVQVPDTGPLWETPERILIRFLVQNEKLVRVEIERQRAPYILPSW